MWDRCLDRMLDGFVVQGRLDVTYPDGRTRRYGARGADPDAPDTPDAHVVLTDPAMPRRIVLAPELGLGEGYMDGTLTIADDDLDGFLTLLTRNAAATNGLWWRRMMMAARRTRRRFDQANPLHRARENVAHHYDLSARLYDLFLDADRHYSCAYFTDPAMSLEAAQQAKLRHIAGKLLLEPGMTVFEIGCGWGGLALHLARDHGARVTAVTLSREQHRYATDRAAAAGLSDRVDVQLIDYRQVTGRFDRIVSVGMFEHVGLPHYGEYFDTVRDRLAPDGVALIHSIGRAGPPGATSPWITKYIFPGGYCPSLSEMAAAVEASGLYACDVEVWRLHYARTLEHWHDRFTARLDQARALYDDRFCRMWRFYLKASEHMFRHGGQCVFQYQLARHQAAVPLTRDYLYGDAAIHQRAAE